MLIEEGKDVRLLLVCLADCVDGDRHLMLLEQVQEAPHPTTRAVLELSLHRDITFSLKANFLKTKDHHQHHSPKATE